MKSSKNMVPWKGKWQSTPAFLPRETQDSMKRQKDITPEDDPPDQKVSSMLLGKGRGQLLIAPRTMKQLGQSKKDSQLRMCPVVIGKSDAL